MKKFVLVIFVIALMFCMIFVNSTSVYAQESGSDISIEELEDATYKEQLKEVNTIVKDITGLSICGCLAVLFSLLVCSLYRKGIKNLSNTTIDEQSKLKTLRTNTAEDFNSMKKNFADTLNTLNELSQEIKEINKEQFTLIHTQIDNIKKAVIVLSSGTNELISNGASEKIANILEEKAVNNNDD